MTSINRILRGFNKNIVQLRRLAEYSTNEADVHIVNAEENMRKAADQTATATQANKIADNIEKMLNGD